MRTSDRRLVLIPILALAACGRPTPAALEPKDSGLALIPCAVAGARAATPVCGIEPGEDAGGGGAHGRHVTVRHPDGGFRRLVLTDAGVEAADGAEAARVTPAAGGGSDVAIGGDRYHLPANLAALR